MKKAIMTFGKAFACLALVVTTMASNSACRLVIYQPKLPAAAEKLRKF